MKFSEDWLGFCYISFYVVVNDRNPILIKAISCPLDAN